MKVASIVEYEGTKYHGFQYQVEVSTVQGELEKSIQKLTGEKIRVSGAGRTDAGVHASGQVISFDLTSSTDFKSVRDSNLRTAALEIFLLFFHLLHHYELIPGKSLKPNLY